MDKRDALIQAREEALKRIRPYKRLFNTPDGKTVLEDLKAEFERELHVPGDSHSTHVRVGEHRVLQYIQKCMEVEEDVG